MGSPPPLQLIATTGSSDSDFKVVALPSLNNSGSVAFTGSLQNGTEGVWLKNGPNLSTLVDSTGSFESLGGACINDQAQLSFGAVEDGNADVRGIYGPSGNRVIGTFNGFSKFSLPAINNNGTIATLALRSSSAENGVYLDGQAYLLNGEFVQVDISPFQAISINDQKDLVFSAIKPDGKQALFLSLKDLHEED